MSMACMSLMLVTWCNYMDIVCQSSAARVLADDMLITTMTDEERDLHTATHDHTDAVLMTMRFMEDMGAKVQVDNLFLSPATPRRDVPLSVPFGMPADALCLLRCTCGTSEPTSVLERACAAPLCPNALRTVPPLPRP